ncbi:MAG: hypothetical protein IJT19_09165, partial [Bacteroidaceae bacterium]|nr:hypothetical protein [Bacteroidaceae bacterium]
KGSEARAEVIGLDFDGTDGIEGMEMENESDGKCLYDLSGRRVAKPTKGLYIVNGKKVLF